MSAIFAIIIMIVSVCLALYLGGFVMFIGGIIDLIEVFKADTVSVSQVTWGIVKIFFASIVGYAIFYIGCIVSAAVADSI